MEIKILQTITHETKFKLKDEFVPRIKKCCDQLTLDEIWKRPNSNLVSVGNLILHLCGNVSQYILFGLGGLPDNRKRQEEFDFNEQLSKIELYDKLDHLMDDVSLVLDKLEPKILTQQITVQGMNYSGFGILMHVVEHFSYHVGQITWFTKLIKDVDMKYYGDKDLNITG
ncbi:MAG: DinB family protein [Cyclobacteriaceae bacterium]